MLEYLRSRPLKITDAGRNAYFNSPHTYFLNGNALGRQALFTHLIAGRNTFINSPTASALALDYLLRRQNTVVIFNVVFSPQGLAGR